MLIAIDIRALMERQYSGISRYSFNLLNALLKIDKKNKYKLFFNNFSNSYKESEFFLLDYANDNVEFLRRKIPNKFLNASIFLFDTPKIDKLIGGADVFFSPNFLFSSFSENCRKVITVHDISFERCPGFYSVKGKLWHKFVRTRKLC